MQFSITHAFPASDKQKNVGILATFNLSLTGPDGTIYVSLNDLKIVESKEGKKYIGSPYREYEGKDKEGNMGKKKIHYIKIFPDKKDWPKQDNIVAAVLAKVSDSNGTVTSNKPAAKPTATTTSRSPSTEAW